MTVTSVSNSGSAPRYGGLSTDTKPTQGIEPFAEFMESDTGAIYRYTGTQWVLKAAPN